MLFQKPKLELATLRITFRTAKTLFSNIVQERGGDGGQIQTMRYNEISKFLIYSFEYWRLGVPTDDLPSKVIISSF